MCTKDFQYDFFSAKIISQGSKDPTDRQFSSAEDRKDVRISVRVLVQPHTRMFVFALKTLTREHRECRRKQGT